MFGCAGADTDDTVVLKRGYMAGSQARWPFLTHFDASTIKNERQLATMVKERFSLAQSNAEKEVREWMAGKVF